MRRPFTGGSPRSILSSAYDGRHLLRIAIVGADLLIEGLVARWAYMALYLEHHRIVVDLRRTVLLALSRLFHRRVSGRLKLH